MNSRTDHRRLSVVVLVSMMLTIAPGPVVAQVGQVEDQSAAWSNPCLVYGSLETPLQNAWLFAIDLKSQETHLLGEALPKAHIPGLAVHPDTGEVFALVRNQKGPKVTTLAQVNVLTGAMAPIGSTGLDFAEGLSFRPTDGTLWAWWRDQGLVRIDPQTAAAQLVLAGDLPVSALAWDPTGAALYLAGNRRLWQFEDGYAEFQLAMEPLPVLVGGLAMRADGQLLLAAAHAAADRLELHVLDPASGAVVATHSAPPIPQGTERPEDEAAAFIGALTWPVACGNPSPGGEADLIQGIQIDKLEVCPGETIHVEVEAVHPEGGSNPVVVSIDGLPGDERVIQLDGAPGPRQISVSAWTAEGYTDRESRQIEVLDCGPTTNYARLATGVNPFHPYTVDFEVANAEDIAPDGAQYEWEFGDGVGVVTDVPFASHSYEESLQPHQEYASFEASVVVHLPEGTALSTPRTVVVWNLYAASRERGLIQPPSSYEPQLVLVGSLLTGEYTLHNLEDGPISLTGRQIEHQPCDPVLDPAALPWEALSIALGPGEEWTDTLTLDAATVTEDVCGVALHLVGEAGTGEQVAADLYFQVQRNPLLAQPVTDEATLTLLNEVAAQGLVLDPDYITDEELYTLSQEGQVDISPATFTTGARASVETAMDASGDDADCDGLRLTPNPIGCECVPGDSIPAETPWYVGSISCQATEEFDRYPPHIPNALKGDVILVGGCNFVGQMLRQLEPPQKYMHTGIMTENYVEIAHSTGSGDRYHDHVNKSVGDPLFLSFDPPVLKYGWPGMIREDIATAFSGKWMTDPLGDDYWMTDFTVEPSGCSGSVVPQLVVKPPPAQAALVRPTLRQAADIAAGMSTRYPEEFNDPSPSNPHYRTGHGHYRFYAYSDSAIALDSDHDNPDGEPATVCSSFVWWALKEAGAMLEGGLDNADIQRGDILNGAELDLQTADGLYLYQAEERLSAGQFMWDYISGETIGELGLLYEITPELAGLLANQLANCFAFDMVQGQTKRYDACGTLPRADQLWRDPGEGRAVSPDNILLWDPPTADGDGGIDHGVYGYSERLVYRSGGWKRVYRWAPSYGTGTVEGTVTYEGQPVAGAAVILAAAGGLEAESGPDGSFRFLAVPAGTYGIEAQIQMPNVFLSSRDQTVTVAWNGTVDVELLLEPPAEEFRQLVFEDNLYHSGGQEPDPEHTWPHYHGYYHRDIQWSFLCYETERWEINDIVAGEGELSCRVDPTNPTDLYWWRHCLGDSCLTVSGSCTLEAEGDITLVVDATLGGDTDRRQYLVPAGDSRPINMKLEGKDWCGPFWKWDVAELWVKVTNTVQNY